ncbi:MAG: rod shape-determining protein MreD [Methylomonas sp.]|nr:rod shape-determining protein MreD [Methylomonas sp.]
MPAHNPVAYLCFLATIAAAMVFRVMSILPSLNEFNPDWIMLALIYWSIALPERCGVFTAFWIGLVTDVLTGHLLGQYALIYALISYLSIKQYRRLRQFPLPQQCLFVLFCLLCGQSLLFGMESMQAPNRLPLSFWYPAFSGTLAWPLVFLILRKIRVLARISE